MIILNFLLACVIVVLILVIGVFLQEWWDQRKEKRK